MSDTSPARTLDKRVRIADIITAASVVWDIPESELAQPYRYGEGAKRSKAVLARAAVVLVARSMPDPPSYPMIGRALGGRDHTTIINALRRAESYEAMDPEHGKRVDRLFHHCRSMQPFVRDRMAAAQVAA